MASAILNDALVYADCFSWPVVLMHSITTGGACSCKDGIACDKPGKHPRTTHGINDASTDPNQIRKWWKQYPDANVGIRMGNGRFGLDVDPRHGGDISLLQLVGSNGKLPESPCAISGNGGIHYMLGVPQGRVKNLVGKLAEGIDIKGDGGYLVAPRSIGATRKYEWKLHPNDVKIAQAPDWLLNSMLEKGIWIKDIVSETLDCHSLNFSEVSEVSDTSQSSSISSSSPPKAESREAGITIDSIIRRTLPDTQGQRNGRILSLARGLKLNLGITDLAQAKVHVREWHRRALPTITTKSFDATWADFLYAFDRARYPLGTSIVDVAAGAVDPDALPLIAAEYDSIIVKQLIALCAALASMNNGRFFISSHDVASRLGIVQPQAWRMLKMLARDGVLEVVDPGNEYKAARFKWRGGE